MLSLYNILITIAGFFLKIIALFNKKIKLFVEGRKQSFKILSEKIQPNDKTIWFHAASLGEFEQGLPVMEEFKKKFPAHKLVLTFFSPSGYEVRKNNTVADVTVYLPWDTKRNVQQFLKIVQPEKAIFIKYEFWINYLSELKKQNIPTYLISGIFRENQAFFKWYGGFYRKALHSFDYFFVQNQSSKKLVESLGFTNVMVSGDTRFDRVFAISERDNQLDFVEEFKGDDLLIVAGSTWESDEKLLVEYINQNKTGVKFVIAPHNIKSEQIGRLKSQINKSVVLFSEKEGKNLSDFEVLIVDTIGILTKIYSYADVAYVGGGFGNPGVHNVLEPAVFGIPIVIGKNYTHFAEATQLVNLKGVLSIKNPGELTEILDKLITDNSYRQEKGKICSHFILSQKGATMKIMNYEL
ncbi:MAG: glycosyltransferase N-terminal domain-containing protein [Flavobacteriaceae bacterium]